MGTLSASMHRRTKFPPRPALRSVSSPEPALDSCRHLPRHGPGFPKCHDAWERLGREGSVHKAER